ncbi:MAG: TetR/AcrR family transcriptional regulator [Bacteroidota bacterium]
MKDNLKKPQILKAAFRRFARHGLLKTTVEEIARDLRIGKATIYHYFSSKEDIFYEVLNIEIDKFIAEITEIFDDPEAGRTDKFLSYFAIKENIKERYVLIYELLTLVFRDNVLEKDGELLRCLLEKEENAVQQFLKKKPGGKLPDRSLVVFMVYQTWGLALTSKFEDFASREEPLENDGILNRVFEQLLEQ